MGLVGMSAHPFATANGIDLNLQRKKGGAFSAPQTEATEAIQSYWK
jgi:hypothetical protein